MLFPSMGQSSLLSQLFSIKQLPKRTRTPLTRVPKAANKLIDPRESCIKFSARVLAVHPYPQEEILCDILDTKQHNAVSI